MAVLAETAPAQAAPAKLWQNRTFLSIWIGHTISIIGDGFHSVALGLWILQTTGSSTAMAAIMAVRALTGVLLGAVAGTVVDRTDRRRMMIAMDAVRFVLVLLVAAMVARQGTSFLLVALVSGLISVAGQFFSPAMTASLVNIVGKEHLGQASGFLQMTNTLAQVIGPFIGGTVVALWGGWAAMTIDAVSFLVSVAFILLGGAFASPRIEKETRSFWGDFKDGIRFIRGHSLSRNVVAFAPLTNFFGNALGGVLLPVIVVKVWNASPFQFGMAESAFPLGFAIGAGLFMAFASKLKRRGYWMFGTLLMASALMTVVPLMPSVNPAIPLYVLGGIFLAFPNVFFMVTMQAEVPTEVQGRVFGTMGSLLSAAAPLAFMVAGPLADIFTPVSVALVFGLGLVGTCVAGLFLAPALRDYK
ncbi:MAG TPA: MFS transporter [Symbiobacteriaceae bacterium]|nr:MFS transporter [Symbiobacteriaceae bacterium]